MALHLTPSQRSNLLLGLWICALIVLVYYILLEVYLYLALIVLSYYGYRYVLEADKAQIVPEGRGVLITGCDTGFGYGTALRLDKLGFTVFAGCLFPDGDGARHLKEAGSKRMHVVQLDITKDEHVQKAVKYVNVKGPKSGLWAVINNAAIGRYGDLELSPMKSMKEVVDVNFYGMVRICQAFMPMLRHSGGRVINVTSIRGLVALPYNGMYTVSKFAGEGYSDTLRREMDRFGVKVVLIEPANFTCVTGLLKPENIEIIKKELVSAWDAAPAEAKRAYGNHYLEPILKSFDGFSQTGCKSMEPVVNAMADAVTNAAPKVRYIVYGGNKLIDWFNVSLFLDAYLPEVIMDYLVRVFDPPPAVAYNVPRTQ